METGNRKLKSQYVVTIATLLITAAYMYFAETIDANVVIFSIIAVGGSGVTMMGANAIGDHGAFKKDK